MNILINSALLGKRMLISLIQYGLSTALIRPIDGRRHRYYPDVVVHQKMPDGSKKTVMIEIKPKSQTRPPDMSKKTGPKGRISKRYLNEVATWGKNEAKWKAARNYCADRGWEFHIYTEQELGIK